MINNHNKFNTWLPALFDGQFHWDFLKPAFAGTKIMPMDFDAVVERNGKFLIFETKSKGKQIDLGQKITLTNQWKKDDTTIIFLEGKDPQNITGYSLYHDYQKNKNVGDFEIIKCNSFDIVFVVRRWFCMASNIAAPDRAEWDRQLWLWDNQRTKERMKNEMV